MKMGIISDTHDRDDRVIGALELLRDEGAEMLIHCGDITQPQTVRLFAGWQMHFVYGNCDGQREVLAAAMDQINATNHQRYGHLEIEGIKLGFLHGDDEQMLHDLEVSNAYDFLFHGHTHVARERLSGPTRVINPGALHRAAFHSVLLLDLPSGTTKLLRVK